ncbi:hypothetical protein HPP92_012498 [Vanilla planifolia]|uniref:Uncharacterized protein n=1 Tax=Vanilla planifolia TaxID=51239 RepID=A0A835QXM3_VANPL|nr:hypothetical protein HPP92_012498 [Vanilla planifolia]
MRLSCSSIQKFSMRVDFYYKESMFLSNKYLEELIFKYLFYFERKEQDDKIRMVQCAKAAGNKPRCPRSARKSSYYRKEDQEAGQASGHLALRMKLFGPRAGFYKARLAALGV